MKTQLEQTLKEVQILRKQSGAGEEKVKLLHPTFSLYCLTYCLLIRAEVVKILAAMYALEYTFPALKLIEQLPPELNSHGKLFD